MTVPLAYPPGPFREEAEIVLRYQVLHLATTKPPHFCNAYCPILLAQRVFSRPLTDSLLAQRVDKSRGPNGQRPQRQRHSLHTKDPNNGLPEKGSPIVDRYNHQYLSTSYSTRDSVFDRSSRPVFVQQNLGKPWGPEPLAHKGPDSLYYNRKGDKMGNEPWRSRLAYHVARFLVCRWAKTHAWAPLGREYWCVLCDVTVPRSHVEGE